MLLTAAIIILPLFFIALLGALLVALPQREASAVVRTSQRFIQSGSKIQTTTGLKGFALTTTRTHVVLATLNGEKYEVLKHLVTPDETSL
jgi:preprotein translocase subunit YajC